MQIDKPITSAVLIVAISALAYFLVIPEYDKFKSLQVDLAEKTAEYDAQRVYYAEITRTHNDLIKYKDDIAKIDDALPQDPSTSKLIYYLQDEIKNNGLTLKSLFLSKASSSSAGTTGSIKEIVFSTDLSGDYDSLERFLISLEKSARIFEVTSISFGAASSANSTKTSGTSTPSRSFSLQIKTYSY